MTKAGFLKSGFSQQGQLWRIMLGMVLAMPPLFFDITGLSIDGERMLAVAILMAAWWALEAMPLAVTALAPLLLCLLYTSPSPRDRTRSRMPSSA